MNAQEEFLKKLVDALNESQIPYMLSGSIGSSFHGQPRATNDADIVIAPTEQQLYKFAQALGEHYYISLNAVREAFDNRTMFNVIDSQTAWKADFIIRKDRAFSKTEFQRRSLANIMGTEIWVTSPEDVILSKLEWSKDSGSEQQFSDALGVAMVQWDHLDRDYLLKWAKQLKIESSVEQLLEQVENLKKED